MQEDYTPHISKAIILEKNISSLFFIEYQQIILLIIFLWTMLFIRYLFFKNIKSTIINFSLDIVLFITIWFIIFIWNNDNYNLVIIILFLLSFIYLKKKLLFNSGFIKKNYYFSEFITIFIPIVIYFIFSSLYFFIRFF